MKNPRYERPRMKRYIRFLVWKRDIEFRKNRNMRQMLDNAQLAISPGMVAFSEVSNPAKW